MDSGYTNAQILNHEPLTVQNQFEVLEIPDDVSLQEHNVEAGDSYARQLSDYRSRQKQRHQQAVPRTRTRAATPQRQQQQKQNVSSKRKAYLVGDSMIKNTDPQRLSNALGGKVEKKKFGGARIEDIQKNVSDLLASESMDCGAQLIIHVGTNNLVNEPEDVVVWKMELLATETKAKVKSIGISSVITRKDS